MAPRGTAAEMCKLTAGKYIPPHDATSYLTVCAQADSIMDTEALPGVLSTTGTNEVALANRISVNLILHGVWAAAGGDLSGKPEPVVLTNQIKAEIIQLLMDTTYDSFTTLDMIDEDA